MFFAVGNIPGLFVVYRIDELQTKYIPDCSTDHLLVILCST